MKEKKLEKVKKHCEYAKYFLADRLEYEIKNSNDNYEEIGNNLGNILKKYKSEVYAKILPSVIQKWASPETLPIWLSNIQNELFVKELGIIGVSIANTMRPLAGNTFEEWVCILLNRLFKREKLNLKAERRGIYKKQLEKKFKDIQDFVNPDTGEIIKMSQKPDIDIVVYHTIKLRPICIISCKTSAHERIMQTVGWQAYLNIILDDIPIYLITAWEEFRQSKINGDRVQSLAGVFICNEDKSEEYLNVRKFSHIIDEMRKYN